MDNHSVTGAGKPAPLATPRATTGERYAIDGIGELRLDGIPAELRAISRWVAWRAIPKPGAAKPGKCPVNPRTGEWVSVAGRSFLRPVVGAEWVLREFPAEV